MLTTDPGLQGEALHFGKSSLQQQSASQGLRCSRPWLQSKERGAPRPQTFAFSFLWDPVADRPLNFLTHTCSEFSIKSGFMLISDPPHPHSGAVGPTHELTLPWPRTLHNHPLPGLGHDFFPSSDFTPQTCLHGAVQAMPTVGAGN